jgi:transcriptional regulator with XRE-family HTH domain
VDARKPAVSRLDGDSLSKMLKRRRLELGLRQVDAASRLGVSQGTILEWERGKKQPSVRCFPEIIRFLGCEPWAEPRTRGDQVFAQRQRRGLSRKRAARLLKIDEGTLAGVEEGRQRATKRIVGLCDQFLGADDT